MQSGLYVAISSQMALEKRLTTIADNMANLNTVGFRSTEVKFDEVLSKTQNDINAKIAFRAFKRNTEFVRCRMHCLLACLLPNIHKPIAELLA